MFKSPNYQLMEIAKQRIVEYVRNAQGCKATELVSCLATDSELRKFNVIDIINSLVDEHKLIEIEYVLPAMDYRVKSFYLPADTLVKVLGRISEE